MTNSTISLEQHEKEKSLLKKQIAHLQEQMDWFKRQLFGKKSERIVDTQDSQQPYFPGLEPIAPVAEKKQKIEGHERKRNATGKDTITFPDDIPVERYVLDIPENEKICHETGEQLVKIGEEITSKLAYRPGSYFIKQFVRPKYAYPQREENGITIVDLPESLLTRCQVDESLLADILVKKYADHLPLYRQSEIMSRDGMNISRQTLCQWTMRASVALKPLFDRMIVRVLEAENIFYDETPIKMLAPGKGKTHQAYMWVLVGGACATPSYRI